MIARNCTLFGMALVMACALTQAAEKTPAELPGPRPDGSVRLPNQWSLRPVGKQVVLGDFPVNIAVHPAGRFAAVLHCGHGQHEIVVVALGRGAIVSRTAINEAFYGLAFSPDGKRIYCSGASDEVIHHFAFVDGYLSDPQSIRTGPARLRSIPAGIAVSEDGNLLSAANVWGHRVSLVKLAATTAVEDIQLGTNYMAKAQTNGVPQTEDEAAITKRAEAVLDKTRATDPFPYGCVVDAKRKRLYVSLWAQSAVAVIDLNTRRVQTRWSTEEHPNEMVLGADGRHLFVANANRNTVSVIDTESGRTLEKLVAELVPNSPPGSTPNSLALSPDNKLLFVANANINTVAVFDVTSPGKSRSLGCIPVGWYPTSVRVTPDGKRLLVANGKGIIPKANRYGPQPGNEPPATVREYIGGLFKGTLSIIDLPTPERLVMEMKRWTARAYSCMPDADRASRQNPETRPPGWEPGHPVPRRLGEPSPIKYCIYIIKENRTYDQILGDMPEGNGDPSLCLFPEHITPNHHQLAREFVLLDNFYVEGEVSADGHEWTVGAYATDFVEKSWPLTYGHNDHKKYTYPSEGNFAIAQPAEGYLWDRAREVGVSYRSYGEFINNGATTNDPAFARVRSLEGHFDPWFRSFDMDYPDVLRARRYISELQEFEGNGDMPRLQLVRLPNDHTSGSALGKPTPRAAVADNDVALGMVVEALSRSKFWAQMAIFVVEDDAQNGPDHVDAHRTIAYVISPYARRKAVDSTMYSTASMLRTMELILGLQPLSQFDAAALPMYGSFQMKPELTAYRALGANVDLDERNQKTAWNAKAAETMDLAREDAADDLLLNEMVWRSVRGHDNAMPAPRRAAFVLTEADEE